MPECTDRWTADEQAGIWTEQTGKQAYEYRLEDRQNSREGSKQKSNRAAGREVDRQANQ